MGHFIAGQLACARGPDLFLRPQHQQLQALSCPAASPRRRWPGAATTGPAPCGWSATGLRCGSSAASPAAMSTPTWRSSALIAAGLHGIDAELELPPEFRGQRLRLGLPTGPFLAARGDGTAPATARWPWRLSANPSSTTTSTRRASSSTPTAAQSPTGSGSVVSNASEQAERHAPDRPVDLRRKGPLRRRGTSRRRSCPHSYLPPSPAPGATPCCCRRPRSGPR